ncbi:MAG: hypothetical protein HC844_10150 [Tabrizicola sp.]|nr:hypothetical protein [Tabrizicola sp.]
MPTNRFGYWIDVTDRASAHEAVRMAGLPMVLIGFNFAVAAITLMTDAPSEGDLTVPLVLAASSILLVTAGFLLRGGRSYLVPFASVVTLPLLTLLIAFLPTYYALIPIFALLLSISGIRGWLWLRRERAS